MCNRLLAGVDGKWCCPVWSTCIATAEAGGEFGADASSAVLAADHHHRGGTASLVGSLVSPHDALVSGESTCAALIAWGDLVGVYLEGPFLSMKRRGAQNPGALCNVDAGLGEALVEAAALTGAPGAIAQMTFTPERPGAELPAMLGCHALLSTIGHTDCGAETASGRPGRGSPRWTTAGHPRLQRYAARAPSRAGPGQILPGRRRPW